VIPIIGTVNEPDQSLPKQELDLEKKIGLPSGQKAWVKMYLKIEYKLPKWRTKTQCYQLNGACHGN
jgi:hypothetical protein